MIPTAIVGFLWGSEVQPGLRSWRQTSGQYFNLPLTSCAHDSNGYCSPFLGFGSAAWAEILKGLESTKICHCRGAEMIPTAIVGPL